MSNFLDVGSLDILKGWLTVVWLFGLTILQIQTKVKNDDDLHVFFAELLYYNI